MIEPIETTGGVQAASGAAKSSSGTAKSSFADLHAAAVSSAASSAPPAPPSDEVWAPVSGVSWYAKIVAGPRTGQYIDLGHGARHGQAFTIAKQGDKTVHVYGSGADAVTIDADKDASQEAPHLGRRARAEAAADRPDKKETWAPVKGHTGYADILDGSRNGLWVNTSGNARTGRAFQIVHRGARTYHIYGEGKNREVVLVSAHAAAKKSPPAGAGGVSPKS